MKDLLFQLIQYPFDPQKKDRLKVLLYQVQDWNGLVELINAHGIIALAAYNIKEAGLANEVPAEAMAMLENGYRQSVVRNIWLTERWKEVNEILGEARIKHILLKGMALEHTIYDARGLRQMNDNDILIKRSEATEAWHLLQKNGFGNEMPKSSLHLKIMRDFSYHMPALKKDGYSLEIHTRLFDHKTNMEMDQPDLFENCTEIKVDNKKALILSKEIHLKYLIWHFERHKLSGESQLRLYADISILSPEKLNDFDDQFIMNPDQKEKAEFRKAAYKAKVHFIEPGYRWLFVLGDLFPSIDWMKKRYHCGNMKAILFYPHRLGKLLWLV